MKQKQEKIARYLKALDHAPEEDIVWLVNQLQDLGWTFGEKEEEGEEDVSEWTREKGDYRGFSNRFENSFGSEVEKNDY